VAGSRSPRLAGNETEKGVAAEKVERNGPLSYEAGNAVKDNERRPHAGSRRLRTGQPSVMPPAWDPSAHGPVHGVRKQSSSVHASEGVCM